MVWYQQPAEAALATLLTSADGLTAAEAHSLDMSRFD